MRLSKGFTLTEVLITLGIIGIIAAMTLPTVVKKYKEKQTIAQIKYSLNILNNAFRLAIADHGDMRDWKYIDNLEEPTNRKIFIDKYLIPYVKGAKVSSQESYDCNGLGYPTTSPPRQPNGNITGMTSKTFYPITLLNGIFFYAASTDNNGNMTIDVDLNGTNPPNIFGYDLFVFILEREKNSVYAVGHNYENPMTSCTKGNAWSCAAAIIKNEYTIPKNYPVKF